MQSLIFPLLANHKDLLIARAHYEAVTVRDGEETVAVLRQSPEGVYDMVQGTADISVGDRWDPAACAAAAFAVWDQ